jgi:ubiquinone/menaquinone biosynthesis C-methylase UbiE
MLEGKRAVNGANARSKSSTGELMRKMGGGPSGPLRGLFEQFGRPSGLLGRLAGYLMSKTDEDDRWVVELLDVRPDDRVLDIGSGPGVTLALIARRATAGFVAGVDPSGVMVRQATERNRAAVQAGRVELRPGSASSLPYPDAHFTKACAVHSLYFWPSVEAGLREVHRVLAPDGLHVLAVRTRRPDAGRFSPSRYGLTDEMLADLVATLASVGFRDVTTRRREMGRQTIAAVLARR